MPTPPPNATPTTLTEITWPSAEERRALRLLVADHIEAHPELHDQGQWGDGSADPSCGTACCVAGWACHLGGGTRGLAVPVAALHLLSVPGMPPVGFGGSEPRARILSALRGMPEPERNEGCSGCSYCSDCSGCSDCSDCSRCSGCSDCSDCSRCSYCSYCSYCSGCSDCSDCSGVFGGVELRDVHYPARCIEHGMRALCGVSQ